MNPPGDTRPAPPPGHKCLHVTNGDSVADPLRLWDRAGEVTVQGEPLHDGPLPAAGDDTTWRAERAALYASWGWDDLAGNRRRLETWDGPLDRPGDFAEIVLWYEADLFDQANLIRVLDQLGRLDLGQTPVRLICIDAFPGIARFVGLGQLDAGQLTSLFPTRQSVTAAMVGLGQRAWRAFASADPTAIEAVIAGDTAALPFLAAALRRQLEQFPWARDGLDRTERETLRALEPGSRTGSQLFQATQHAEERPFLGDSSFWRILDRLESGTDPLIAREVGTQTGHAAASFALTEAGRAVLAGRADAAALLGRDRWVGNVHLPADGPGWRWDDAAGRVVRV